MMSNIITGRLLRLWISDIQIMVPRTISSDCAAVGYTHGAIMTIVPDIAPAPAPVDVIFVATVAVGYMQKTGHGGLLLWTKCLDSAGL